MAAGPVTADGAVLARDWRRRGRMLPVHGHEIFALQLGPVDAPCLGVLHGFPSSSIDFHRVVDRLAEDHRVILHDHLGFGFSDKPRDATYSLLEQAEYAVEVWRRLGARRIHLLAHDYGTSVATELLARRERGRLGVELTGVTLVNGSVLLELARLRLSQRIARSRLLGPLFGRLVTRGYFVRVMRRLWAEPAHARTEDLVAIWESIRHQDGQRLVHRLSRYLEDRVRFRERWVGALQRLDLPAHVLWGRRDPVATAAIAEALAAAIPGASLTWLDRCGHYPMLEQPEAWARAVLAPLP